MKNSILLIVGIIAAAAVMIPLNYNALTDHYRYAVPLKNSHVFHETTHVDIFSFAGFNDTFSDNMYDITPLDAQTVKISFRNHGKLPP